MNLLFANPFGKKEKKEYFLCLLLREEKVSAVIFEEVIGKIQVIGESETYFTDTIEQTSEEELLKILDETISEAESNLPANVETQKTIFGVREDWVDGAVIKKTYLAKLKKVSDVLGLSPIGFLIIQEAIAHLLQKEEGAPVSAILVEVGSKNLAVSLLRAGRVLETKRIKIEDDISTATDRLLHHFTEHEVLPSRIILFNGEKAEELSQDFISHAWSKSLPFLHVPQITVLPKGFDAKAVLFGAATQMGFEVLGQDLKSDEKAGVFEQEDVRIKKEDLIPKKTKVKEESHAENLGFFREEDITPTPTLPTLALEQPTQKQSKIVLAEVLTGGKVFLKSSFLVLSHFFSLVKLPDSLPQKRSKMLFIPPIFIASLILFILLYIFAIKADIALSFRPKNIQDEQNVTFSAGKPTDPSTNRVQANLFDVEETGNQDTNATGKKEVGDKAKGTVTILSSLTNSQSIPGGTTIVSTNGLSFTLDKTVQIASSSGISDVKSQQASITAKDIGKEYNLPSGTKFSVGTFDRSSVEAKNDTAFSGGSKKEITVVSKTDMDKAVSELLKKLEEKAKEDAKKKVSGGEELLPAFISSDFSKKEFSKNVGEETSTVTLKATASFKSISYKKSELDSFAKTLLSKKQQDMIFSSEGITYNVEKVEKTGERDVKAALIIKASLIPKVDTTSLAKNLSGKSFKDTEVLLLKLPQASDVRIKLVPNIPLLPKVLPRLAKNIRFTITLHE